MPRFKVTVVERQTWYVSKVFEAKNEDEARQLAEMDETWTDLDGWEDSGEVAGECGVEEIEEIK